MHRSTTFTLVLFLFFSLQLYSQHQDVNVTVTTPKYIEWNDLTFRLSKKGIKSFIQELEDGDPEMYDQMQFDYNQLINKQRTATTIGILGSAIGIAFAIAGFDSTPVLVTGTTVASFSFVYAIVSGIKENDWLNLINSYNKSTNNKKIKISLQPLITSQITGGMMSLQLQF